MSSYDHYHDPFAGQSTQPDLGSIFEDELFSDPKPPEPARSVGSPEKESPATVEPTPAASPEVSADVEISPHLLKNPIIFQCSREALPYFAPGEMGTDIARRTPEGEIIKGPGRGLSGSLKELLDDRDWSQTGLPPTQEELDLADDTEDGKPGLPLDYYMNPYSKRVTKELEHGSFTPTPTVLHLQGYTALTMGIKGSDRRKNIFNFLIEGNVPGQQMLDYIGKNFPNIREQFEEKLKLEFPTTLDPEREFYYKGEAPIETKSVQAETSPVPQPEKRRPTPFKRDTVTEQAPEWPDEDYDLTTTEGRQAAPAEAFEWPEEPGEAVPSVVVNPQDTANSGLRIVLKPSPKPEQK